MIKYNKLMSHLELSTADCQRIGQNALRKALDDGTVQSENEFKSPTRLVDTVFWRQLPPLAAVLAIVVFILGALFWPGLRQPRELNPDSSFDSEVMVPAEVQSFASWEALEAACGFSVSHWPTLEKKAAKIELFNYSGNLAEVVFKTSEGVFIYRQSLGEGDNSGNYENYKDKMILAYSGQAFDLQGDGESFVILRWTRSGNSYSIQAAPGQLKTVWEQLMAEFMGALG